MGSKKLARRKKTALTVSIRFGGVLPTARSAPPATTVANDLVTLASKIEPGNLVEKFAKAHK